jgi:hypothetical protein
MKQDGNIKRNFSTVSNGGFGISGVESSGSAARELDF